MNATATERWIEVGNGALTEAPPRSRDGEYHWILLVNRVTVSHAKGGPLITRTVDSVELVAESDEAVEAKVAEYVDRPDVRLLAAGIQVNTLPRRERATESLLAGVAPIYQPSEA